jgi:predicted RNase H-like HicB family nuclease
MKIKVLIHEAEEGGYWAEVPSILVVLLKEILLKNSF